MPSDIQIPMGITHLIYYKKKKKQGKELFFYINLVSVFQHI